METSFRPLRSPGKAILAVWAGWIVPPALWLIQFQTRYALVPWACRTGERWAVPTAGGIAFVASLILCFFVWRIRNGVERPPLTSFVGMVGVGISFLFALAIAAQLIPDLFLDPCVQ